MPTSYYLQRLAEAISKRSTDTTRHKCFISYHADDSDEVEAFIESFGEGFIPRIIGVSDSDDFIDSTDTNYIMDAIREKYLTDSTVTIVLIGKCTWGRKFVDWEVYSTLRNDKKNRRSGLLAITLPSVSADPNRKLAARVSDNVSENEKYARWYKYPTTTAGLRSMISEAFTARTSKAHLIDNTRQRRTNNSACP